MGLILLDRDLRVGWANRAAGELMRIDPAEVVGRSALDFVHPDDVELATLAIAVGQHYPTFLEPATYRLVRGDGTEATFDIMGSFSGLDDATSIYLVISPVAYRVGIERTYSVLAAGAPFEDVMTVLMDSMRESLPETWVLAVTEADAAHRAVWGADLDPALWSFVDEWDPEGTGPGDEPLSVTLDDLDSLPAATRDAARRHGFTAVAVERIRDPGASRPAYMLGWARDPLLADRCRIRTNRKFADVLTLILERHAHLRSLERAARSDGLTGLPNRLAFVERLRDLDRGPQPCALLFVDLDDFKEVNDRHGHVVGDRFLHAVSRRIAGALRGRDFVARIGGDEFAVLCPGTGDDGTARAIARRILDSLRDPVRIDGISIQPGASVGIALDTGGGRPGASMLDSADAAMYAAKRAGKGRSVLVDVG